jgi:hypothetical protein
MIGRIQKTVLAVGIGSVFLATGCAETFKQDEAAAKQMPVDCRTAQGDLRVLQSEKANVVERIAMGVTMIYPASAVLSLIVGVEGTKYQVATNEYNDAIDQKIAQIKSTCGIK